MVIRFPKLKEKPLAISVKFLKKNPMHENIIGDHKFVVLTDKTVTNRVYETTNTIHFKNTK